MTKHIVQYSGGIGSFAAAMRVAKRHGTDDMTLLVADAKSEDPDLWRFVDESSRHLGLKPVIVSDGRTPFEVFRDVRFLGNSRLAPCSHLLKQKPCLKWVEENADPADTVLYIGIENTKRDRARIPGIARNWKPWRVQFPLCNRWEPVRSKGELLDEARAVGIEPPRIYDWAEHNNCWGMCVRAGKKHWAALWKNDPERYAQAERNEQGIRDYLGKPVTILREQVKGDQRSVSLAEYRLRLEAQAAAAVADGDVL